MSTTAGLLLKEPLGINYPIESSTLPPQIGNFMNAFIFQSLVESMSVGFAILDAMTEQITYANPQFTDILKVKIQLEEEVFWGALVGQSPFQLPHSPSEKPSWECLCLEPGTQTKLVMSAVTFKHRGREWIGVVVHRLAPSGRKAEIAQSSGNSITMSHLPSPNEAVISNLNAIAHDLQTPVISINGHLGMLLRDFSDELGPRAKVLLEKIKNNTDGISRHTDQLKQLVALGAPPLRRESVNLHDVLRNVLADLDFPIRERKVAIRVDGALPVVKGDPDRLHSVFNNLISNAVKFMGQQPSPLIVISVEDDPDWHRISVKDNGIGIHPTWLTDIFSPFKRVGDLKVPGDGMGLSFCHMIINMAGGSIWADSTPGHGTTITFTWPKEGRQVP